MTLQDLFTGIGIVIDDNVNAASGSDDRIVKIVSYLEEECHIPLVKYEDVPDVKVLEHCHSINFIIIDWSLLELPLGANAAELEQESHERILHFLAAVETKCFAPVFLFSNEEISSIEVQVRKVARRLPILFKSKSEIVDENSNIKFWESLEDWLDERSGIYVQKVWNTSFEKARVRFMTLLNHTSRHWPKVICKSAEIDSVSPSVEINNLIMQNLLSRMDPVEFDLAQIEKDNKVVQSNDILPILEFQRFCPAEFISDHHSTGDFYKKDGKFYINIRPACDCVPRDNFDEQLYLLECTPHGKKVQYDSDFGNHIERSNEVIIGPILSARFFSVKLKRLEIVKLPDFKDFRIGRIQHPFITRILQKFSLYVQRQGLPRIPMEVIFSPEEIAQMKSKE